MREDIRKRIDAVRRGEVPEGYQQVDGYVIPKAWHLEAFSKKFKRSLRRNTSACNNVLTISAQLGLVSQKEYYDKDIASEDKSGYFLLQRGEFAYNKSYSSGYPYGAIKRLEKYEEGIVSPLYICFEQKQETNTDFYAHYFEAGLYNREIYRFAQEGARNHGLLNISTEDFFNGVLIVPPAEEQHKIADILSACDRVIDLKQKHLEELKQLKKTCLAKMFPKGDAAVPELRFPGFTDPWEQRKLGEICISFEYGLNAAAKDYDGENKYIRITDIDDVTRTFLQNDITTPDFPLESADNYLLREGDIVFARTGASVGKSYIYKEKGGKMYYAGFLIRARIKADYNAEFVFQNTLTSEYEKYIRITSQRSGQPGVNAQEYAEYELLTPKIEEQIQIGDFLRSLDDLIALHQRELEAEQQKKKALMKLLLTGLVRVNA